jgi:Arc/MetJ-type ribon-helix-helix transcriptional regulator
MATVKVTITLPEEQLAAIRQLVESGRVRSVSGFVQHAVDVSLGDVAGWGVLLEQALAETGGPLRAEERTWADTILKPPKRTKRGREAA